MIAELVVFSGLQIASTWACRALLTNYENEIVESILGGRAFLFNTYKNDSPETVHFISSSLGAFIVVGVLVGPLVLFRILINSLFFFELDPSLIRSPILLHFAIVFTQQCTRLRIQYEGVRLVGIDITPLPKEYWFYACRVATTLFISPLVYDPGMEMTVYLLEIFGEIIPSWPSLFIEMDNVRVKTCPDLFDDHPTMLIFTNRLRNKTKTIWEIPGRFALRLIVLLFAMQMRWWSPFSGVFSDTAPILMLMSYQLGDVIEWAWKKIHDR